MNKPNHCGDCGVDMKGPGDWGRCYSKTDCLQRQVNWLKEKVEGLIEREYGESDG